MLRHKRIFNKLDIILNILFITVFIGINLSVLSILFIYYEVWDFQLDSINELFSIGIKNIIFLLGMPLFSVILSLISIVTLVVTFFRMPKILLANRVPMVYIWTQIFIIISSGISIFSVLYHQYLLDPRDLNIDNEELLFLNAKRQIQYFALTLFGLVGIKIIYISFFILRVVILKKGNQVRQKINNFAFQKAIEAPNLAEQNKNKAAKKTALSMAGIKRKDPIYKKYPILNYINSNTRWELPDEHELKINYSFLSHYKKLAKDKDSKKLLKILEVHFKTKNISGVKCTILAIYEKSLNFPELYNSMFESICLRIQRNITDPKDQDFFCSNLKIKTLKIRDLDLNKFRNIIANWISSLENKHKSI